MDYRDLETSDQDDEAPQDLGFAASRSSAVQQRERELLSSKQLKQQKKTGIKKQQSWFHEQKIAKVLKKSNFSGALIPDKGILKKVKAAKDRDDEETETFSDALDPSVLDTKKKHNKQPTPRRKGLKLPKVSVDDTFDDDSLNETQDFIPLVKSKSGRNIHIVSMTRIQKQAASAFRPETLAFAMQRFNPSNIPRIAASRLQSIAAKRAVKHKKL